MKNKSFSIRIPFTVILLIAAFFFRVEIFTALGNFLIVEDDVESVETAFVLSGGAFDRGNHTANLKNLDFINNIYCTGANQPPDFKALKIDMLESELTRKNIISQIDDSTKVSLIRIGTSTKEESDAILNFCKENNIKECLIISSMFHTRRIHKTFKKKFKEEGITVYISGAKSSAYDEKQWWKSENGLIALNNEYIKLVYYLIKY